MRKSIALLIAASLAAAVIAGCSGQPAQTENPAAKPKPVSTLPTTPPPSYTTPDTQAPAPAPVADTPAVPGDLAALNSALGEASPITYEIIVVDEQVADKDAHLDKVLAERKWPEQNSLVLLLFAQQNYDIRFAMGSVFFQQKVGVTEVLGFVRESYLPAARKGDPASGLASLIRQVNQRMAP